MCTRSVARYLIVGALLTSACSSSKPASLAAPTAPGASPAASAAGVSVTGTVRGVSVTSGAFTTMSVRLTVTVVGTSISSDVDGNGRFTLSGIQPGRVDLRFDGPGTAASLTLGTLHDGEHLDITVTVNGTTATLIDRDDVELKGTVSALSGSCPALTFTVAGTSIKTNAATKFDGVACTGLTNGLVAEVEGKRQADGSVLATEVQVEKVEREVKGTISGLSGSCPALSFTVAGTSIKTNAATKFGGMACASLTNGLVVEIEGTLQPDGSVLAAQVQVEGQGDHSD